MTRDKGDPPTAESRSLVAEGCIPRYETIAIRRSLQLIGAPMSSDKHESPSLLFLLLLPREYSCGQVHTIITVKVRRGTISAGTRSFRFGATATTHKFTAFFSGDRTGVMSIHHAARWDYVTTLPLVYRTPQ